MASYETPEIRNFLGLYKQANSFNLPDGALETANNFLVQKDGILQKSRGFYQYLTTGDTMVSATNYKDTIIVAQSSKLSYLDESGASPNEVGTKNDITGDTVTISTGSCRFSQSNKNLYFTSDNGAMKLEETNNGLFKAGVPPAEHIEVTFAPDHSLISNPVSFVDTACQFAYRAIFGRRDLNDNLLLSKPSDFALYTNSSFSVSTSVVATTATVTADHGHVVGTIFTIKVLTSSNTSQISLGEKTATAATSTTFTFTVSGGGSPTITFIYEPIPLVSVQIPSEITNVVSWFCQLYRTSRSVDANTTPDQNFKLVQEIALTSTDISIGMVFFNDDVDDLALGSELYTNPNSREGELQSNERPPKSTDIALFKNSMLYSNCTTRPFLEFQLISDSLSSSNKIYVQCGTIRTYEADDANAGNKTMRCSGTGTGTITITCPITHGLSTGAQVVIKVLSGTATSGYYTVTVLTTTTFTVSSLGNTITKADIFAITQTSGGNNIFFSNASSGGTVAQGLRITAQALIKAINSDVNSNVYATYASGLEDNPGKIRLTAKNFSNTQITLKVDTTTIGSYFSPALPTGFGPVASSSVSLPNYIYISKIGEPEAVPLVNFIAVGARNYEIQRIIALRDSCIVIKKDGIFRINGDSITSFSVSPLDSTIYCVAANSVSVINNQIIMLSNQGYCLITESSVQIISRKIENLIQPIIGYENISNTSGFAYESERLYLTSTIEPNGSDVSKTYAYNVLNDSWTTLDQTFIGGVLTTNDTMLLLSTANIIVKERKKQTRIDYCGQNYNVTIVSVASDNLSGVVTSASRQPMEGDVIVKNNTFTRIISSTNIGGSDFNVIFDSGTNLNAADSVILYAGYESEMKLAPFHAGRVSRMKQFVQMQIHTRDSVFSKCRINFSGNLFSSTTSTLWDRDGRAQGSSLGGWGNESWGLFSWGQSDAININTGTAPAPILRVYVPRDQQRNTFIQPILNHKEAGEQMNIQALSFAIRAYGERTTR